MNCETRGALIPRNLAISGRNCDISSRSRGCVGGAGWAAPAGWAASAGWGASAGCVRAPGRCAGGAPITMSMLIVTPCRLAMHPATISVCDVLIVGEREAVCSFVTLRTSATRGTSQKPKLL
jgi:hypothetical protein